jgi:hypothetical protein
VVWKIASTLLAAGVLATLASLAVEGKRDAAFALAELLRRRGLERTREVLVEWARPLSEEDARSLVRLVGQR